MAAQFPGPCVSIRNSLHLNAADVAELERDLVAQRNRFVSLQLVTMVREQVSKNAAAVAARDEEWLRQAEDTFLATVTSGGSIVGAALFYPRLPKQSAGKPANKSASPASVSSGLPGTISLTARAGPGPSGAEEVQPTAVQLVGGEAAQLVELPLGQCGADSSSFAAAVDPVIQSPAGCAAEYSSHIYVDLLVVNTPGRGFGAALLRQIELFVKDNTQQLGRQHGHIAGIRLLSVSSAQAFYERLGYGPPDANHESFKTLAAVA